MADLRPLHAMVDCLTSLSGNAWTEEKRARWLNAIEKAVDYTIERTK